MSLQPTNIPQLQNMGLTPAANMVNTGISAMISAREGGRDRRNKLLQALLGGAVDVGQTVMNTDAQRDIAEQNQQNQLLLEKFRQPNRLLRGSSNFFEGAKAAADAGDFERQQQLNQMGQEAINQALSGLEQLPGGSMSASLAPTGAPTAKTPTSAQGQATSEAEVEAPSGEMKPIAGQLPQSRTDLPFSTQKAISDTRKKQAEGAKASLNLSTLQSIQQAQGAPDGTQLKGAGNVDFEGLKLNPNIRSLLDTSLQQSANDPKKLSQERKENANNTRTILNVSRLFEDIRPLVTEDFGKDILNRIATGSSLGLRAAIMAGLDKSKIGTFNKAKAAIDQQKGLIAVLARKISGEVGALREEDIQRAKGLVPLVTDPPEVFDRKQELFAESVYPLLMEDSLKVLDPVTFNRVQAEYRKVFGKDFDFSTRSNLRDNNVEQVNLDVNAQPPQGSIDNQQRNELLELMQGVF